jgi:uncharacterized protein (DUF58 family)
VRTSVLAGLTTRGSSFLAAGVAAAFAGYLLGERSLIGVGIALIALPLLTLFAARRAHYRLTCTRLISPPRIPAGSTAKVTLRLHNVTRMPTGLLLAEDAIPFALGTRPRYVLDKIERNGSRELGYLLRSDLRGKFEVGPLQLRVADSFGLVEISRSFSTRTDLVVTPTVYPLARTVISRAWANEGEGRSRLTASAGEDDVIPRAYRDGDDMRRVHWRSTARYGELMVRREEQRRRNRATVLLDARVSGHLGSGPNSSFEFAVSAAASVGVHLAQEGLIGRLITHDGTSLGAGVAFEDMLLDSLAVVKPARSRDFSGGIKELRSGASGVIVAVLGRISQPEARQLAACRAPGCQAIALLLAVRTWADTRRGGQPARATDAAAQRSVSPSGIQASEPGAAAGDDEHGIIIGSRGVAVDDTDDTAAAAAELRAAGWHTIRVEAGTPLPVCWQRLPRAAEMLVPAATLGGHEGVEAGRPA